MQIILIYKYLFVTFIVFFVFEMQFLCFLIICHFCFHYLLNTVSYLQYVPSLYKGL